MSGTYLLDTNAVIALFDQNADVEKIVDQAGDVVLSAITLGELYFGAEKSGHQTENLARIDEFAARRTVLNCDTQTARWYGRIRRQLQSKGRPIPENDIWIAAIARQYDLPLLTADKHFSEIEGLLVEHW